AGGGVGRGGRAGAAARDASRGPAPGRAGGRGAERRTPAGVRPVPQAEAADRAAPEAARDDDHGFEVPRRGVVSRRRLSRSIMGPDPAVTQTNRDHTAENIKTLKDAAPIRQNPGMYVGNTHSAGLHHLVYEIVYNSVDEALAGFCTHIKVALHVDGSVSVIDD